MAVLLEQIINARKKGRVLDAGCGDGEVAHWLAGQGLDVIATDPEIPPSLTGTCEQIGNGSVRWYNRDFLTFQTGEPFDVICLFGVLHYARDANHVRQMLGHSMHLLAPSGLLALNWITPDIPLVKREGFLPPRYLVSNTMTSLHAQVQTQWSSKVEHAHGNTTRHRHVIEYAIWRMAVSGA